jgi:prepilin-type N-terminal cleavage/methylation domain-containing protein
MNKKGFTLVELVVAIAALAICSGFILSMYFTSDELSDDAGLYDEAMNQVSYIAETFKASTDPQNFAQNFHLDAEEGAASFNWTIYYNKDWYTEESLDNAYVVLFIELEPEAKYDSGTLYSLRLDFFKVSGEEQENLISITSKKYYPGGAQ